MNDASTVSVVIVEDDSVVRESLATLIDDEEEFSCRRTFASCEVAIPEILDDPPNIVLMDIGLPGMSGLDGIRRLRKGLPDLDIVVLTIHDKTDVVFEALCAGACGYLIKHEDPDRLSDALREVHAGGAPMSTSIARMIVESFRTRRPADSPLTKRETEVLSELCTGKSYRVIAETLFISEETVRRHLKNIYRKLEVHSKSEAVTRAYKDGLVPLNRLGR